MLPACVSASQVKREIHWFLMPLFLPISKFGAEEILNFAFLKLYKENWPWFNESYHTSGRERSEEDCAGLLH